MSAIRDEKVIAKLLWWAKFDARDISQDWPGFPLAQLPEVDWPYLNAALDAGELVVVDRPTTCSTRTHQFVVVPHEGLVP